VRTPLKIAALAASILLGWAGWTGLNALMSPGRSAAAYQAAQGEAQMTKKVEKTKEEWKKTLSPLQYKVMIQCGTERAFSGKYNDFYEAGIYTCAACGAELFASGTKYDHGTGWPSFTAPTAMAAVEFRNDDSLGMHRVEVRCASCGAHLGHVFDDGPGPDKTHYCINSAALNFIPAAEHQSADPSEAAPSASMKRSSEMTGTATFAAGCFWGVEYKFDQVPGVLSTVVGYTGGHTENPTYAEVCTDRTGHAEAVRVTFDPAVVTYEQLVRKFFEFHDPTQLNRQGPDKGTQYRSAIFTYDDAQQAVAEKVKAELGKSGIFRKKVVTEIVPASTFTPAEEYHQKYYEKNKIGSCAIK
jgi:peptide methionine sulfoxide reductase msrA/msrB